MWDPVKYLAFGDHRARPFHDLVGRIAAERPRRVVDLGCGPGNLTATLAERWPDAEVVGVDNSPEMLGKAAPLAVPGRLRFEAGDIAGWSPPGSVDLIVSNAAFQWVGGHEALL